MQLILSNPTEREMIRMRQAAQDDWITIRNSERRAGRNEGMINTLTNLVIKGRLSVQEAAEEANMSVQAFVKEAGISE